MQVELSDAALASNRCRTAHRLKDKILDGTYGPGERLNEVRVAQELGISRSKMREAVEVLASEGLVQRVANRGIFVTRLDADDLVELYELREAIEMMAARLAAVRATGEQISALTALLADTQAMLESGEPVPYPRDLDFHVAILEIAANSRLYQRGRQVHQQLAVIQSRAAYRPARAKQVFREHRAVAEAVADGDPERAATEMHHHLEASLRQVRALPSVRAMPSVEAIASLAINLGERRTG